MILFCDKNTAQVARDIGLKETSLYAWVSQYSGEVFGTNHDMTVEK